MLPGYWLQRLQIAFHTQTRSDIDQVLVGVKWSREKYPVRLHLPGIPMAVPVLPGRSEGRWLVGQLGYNLEYIEVYAS